MFYIIHKLQIQFLKMKSIIWTHNDHATRITFPGWMIDKILSGPLFFGNSDHKQWFNNNFWSALRFTLFYAFKMFLSTCVFNMNQANQNSRVFCYSRQMETNRKSNIDRLNSSVDQKVLCQLYPSSESPLKDL